MYVHNNIFYRSAFSETSFHIFLCMPMPGNRFVTEMAKQSISGKPRYAVEAMDATRVNLVN